MGSETKQIGKYLCFKATATIPNTELTWYSFSWGELRNKEPKKEDENTGTAEGETEVTEIEEIPSTQVEAWYTSTSSCRSWTCRILGSSWVDSRSKCWRYHHALYQNSNESYRESTDRSSRERKGNH